MGEETTEARNSVPSLWLPPWLLEAVLGDDSTETMSAGRIPRPLDSCECSFASHIDNIAFQYLKKSSGTPKVAWAEPAVATFGGQPRVQTTSLTEGLLYLPTLIRGCKAKLA